MSAVDDILVSNIASTGSTPITVPVYPIPMGVTIAFEATIVAADSAGNSAAWAVVGCAKNVGGTISLVGNPMVNDNPSDTAATAWTVSLGTDAIGLNATLTGQGALPIRWSVRSRVTLTP